MSWSTKRRVAQVWADPVWSKVIAGVILAGLPSLYLITKAALQKTSISAAIAQQNAPVSITVPQWLATMIVAVTGGTIAFVLVRRYLFIPRHFLVRVDNIVGPGYFRNHLVIDRTQVRTVRELVRVLVDSYTDEGLDRLTFGTDWSLHYDERKEIKELSDQLLADLGISGGMVLEAHVRAHAIKKLNQ